MQLAARRDGTRGTLAAPASATGAGSFQVLADEIRKAPRLARVKLVAVDGPAGAGKSTFARRLSLALGGAPVVSLDDFLAWGDLESWWPRFAGQVLSPLLAGRPATYQARDWSGDWHGDTLGTWRTVCPAPVVVVEGVTASRRAAAAWLTSQVFVDAPGPVRLERGLARDGERARRLWRDWMGREARFFIADRTRERADVVVDGTAAATGDPEREFRYLADRAGVCQRHAGRTQQADAG
jgi:uridine kinase